jgi:hypothetical protein
MFWVAKSNYGLPVNKSLKVLEVYLEDLPRVIGRGLSDLSSRGIRWGLSVLWGKTQLPQPDVQLIQQLELVYQTVVSLLSSTGFKFLTPLLYYYSAAEELVSFLSEEFELKSFIMLSHFLQFIFLMLICVYDCMFFTCLYFVCMLSISV